MGLNLAIYRSGGYQIKAFLEWAILQIKIYGTAVSPVLVNTTVQFNFSV